MKWDQMCKTSSAFDESRAQFSKECVKIALSYPFHSTDHESAAWILLLAANYFKGTLCSGANRKKKKKSLAVLCTLLAQPL